MNNFRTLTAFLFLIAAAASRAQTVVATFNGENPTTTIDRVILDDSPPYPNETVRPQTVGLMQFTRSGGDFVGQLMPYNTGPDTFVGFCIEPRQFVSNGGSYTWSVGPLSSATIYQVGPLSNTKIDLLGTLFAMYYPNFGAPLTPLEAGALQISTWEIIRETATVSSGALDLNVSRGNIYFLNEGLSGLMARAQTMLDSLNHPTASPLTNLRALYTGSADGGAQDMVVQIPEPATCAVILGVAALGFVTWRRRGQRRQEPAPEPQPPHP